VDYTRTELVIFIRPSILKNPGEASEMSRKAIEGLKEKDIVNEYLETGTTGDTYMEGSGFEEKPPRKPAKSRLSRFR
jgi:type II secretory pathway component GspD/PulD (secretin)